MESPFNWNHRIFPSSGWLLSDLLFHHSPIEACCFPVAALLYIPAKLLFIILHQCEWTQDKVSPFLRLCMREWHGVQCIIDSMWLLHRFWNAKFKSSLPSDVCVTTPETVPLSSSMFTFSYEKEQSETLGQQEEMMAYHSCWPLKGNINSHFRQQSPQNMMGIRKMVPAGTDCINNIATSARLIYLFNSSCSD